MDFHCTLSANNIQLCHCKLHSVTVDGQDKSYLPHYFETSLGPPSYIIGNFLCTKFPYHPSNVLQFLLSCPHFLPHILPFPFPFDPSCYILPSFQYNSKMYSISLSQEDPYIPPPPGLISEPNLSVRLSFINHNG